MGAKDHRCCGRKELRKSRTLIILVVGTKGHIEVYNAAVHESEKRKEKGTSDVKKKKREKRN